MKLLAISNPDFFPYEAEIINSLLRAGLECMHIRKPESDQADLRKLLTEISTDFSDKISLHQHHVLATEFGIKRLHFTEKDRKSAAVENLNLLYEQGCILSTSVHDLNEIYNLPTLFRYTFFGPVFDSISKAGYRGVLPDDFYIRPEMKKVPVIGLGGIDHTNLVKVREMNFDGAAVLGTLWKDPGNGVDHFRVLMNMVNRLNGK